MEQLRPLRAIVWAQWATSRNFYMRANKGGLVLKWLMGLVWYGMWVLGSVAAGYVVSGRVPMGIVERALPGALFLVFFFWQLFPILLASQGAFLDLRRLLVYPIPEGQMFALEVALRVTTAVEMLLVCAGLMVGLWCNPEVRVWAPLVILVFMVFNLFLATGIKALMERWFKKKGVRELMMVFFLALILVPQLFAAGIQEGMPNQFALLDQFAVVMRVTPWIAVGALALGKGGGVAVASLTVSTALAYLFARIQFARSLRLEEGEGDGPRKAEKTESTWLDAVVRWPGAVLLDPVAAVVEKDLRTLARSPRFRLIFMMASTFGAVLWLPQALRSKGGWMANNYITMASLYGILVLGEVLYWNVLGFERTGAQQWFVTPVGFRDVLRAKNMVAIVFTVLTIAILSAIAMVLPIGVGATQVADALSAAAVFLVSVMGGGNLTSVYMPRPIDPDQAWRNNASKTQFMLLAAYPVLTIPVAMAHLARWATDSYWAYHAVLGVAFVVALCFYHVATETAVEVAEERKENIVAALSRTDGPVSIST